MHFDIRKAVIVLLSLACLSACVSINSITPEPAAPGDVVRLHLSNVIGPMSVEPGAMVTFDGMKMPLKPDTASVVGFVVPEGTADADHQPMEILTAMGDLEDLDSWLKEFVSEYDEIDGDTHEVWDGIYWNRGGPDTEIDLGNGIMPGYHAVAAARRRSGSKWSQEEFGGPRWMRQEESREFLTRTRFCHAFSWPPLLGKSPACVFLSENNHTVACSTSYYSTS